MWTRFSAEFAPGGLIDGCSATERQLAWMTSTNNANEGALGAYRVAMRGKASLTVHQYNAQAMFRRNDTQDFMDAVLTPDDHAYIMREARRIEARTRQKIVDFRVKTAVMQKEKAVAKIRRDAILLREALTLPLVLPAKMAALTVPKIVEQLKSYHARGVPNILPMSKHHLKSDKLAALKIAYEWYKAHGKPVVLPDLAPENVELLPQIVEDWQVEEDVEMED